MVISNRRRRINQTEVIFCSEKLLIRDKQVYDGAIPSGNSVAALNLLRLGHITGETDYVKRAESITKAFSESIDKYPAGHAHLMMALAY